MNNFRKLEFSDLTIMNERMLYGVLNPYALTGPKKQNYCIKINFWFKKLWKVKSSFINTIVAESDKNRFFSLKDFHVFPNHYNNHGLFLTEEERDNFIQYVRENYPENVAAKSFFESDYSEDMCYIVKDNLDTLNRILTLYSENT